MLKKIQKKLYLGDRFKSDGFVTADYTKNN